MSASGRAGNGRGNNRRRPFRRRDHNSDHWQAGEEKRSPGPFGNNLPRLSNDPSGTNSSKAPQKVQEKKARDSTQEDNHGRRNFGRNNESTRVEKAAHFDRPKWIPPKINTDPLPVPVCPFCGKPIQDISQAISDRDTGIPIHFDCVTSKIADGEKLEKNDSVTYIGGGRFGIVNFSNMAEFKIKKIIEWENKEKRAEWRTEICEHYSVT